ncbi:MAG: hypothetical protein ABI451_07330 [Dokdonella sp.]
MLVLADIDLTDVRKLLADFDLRFELIDDGLAIPGSYWGEPEAGIIGSTIHARGDTPVHSLLHEAGHLIVQSPERRASIHTNATDSVAEEDACCYLQVVLADRLGGVTRERIMRDMDEWGYTFRLGSTNAWFEHDASETRAWLIARGFLQ